MKKFLTLFACLGLMGLSLAACSDDDQPVSKATLPQAAQNFITTYFSGEKVQKVEKDMSDGKITYDVRFANGYQVEFDEVGDWLDVDAPARKVIPAGIAPEPIVTYVETKYPGDGINEISREYYGYEAELVSGIDLKFDTTGNFITPSF